MKSRSDTVKFIREQFDQCEIGNSKSGRWHYGMYELRSLLDYIYESKPNSDEERIFHRERRGRKVDANIIVEPNHIGE